MTSQTKRNHSETFNAKEFYDLCDKVDKEEDFDRIRQWLNTNKDDNNSLIAALTYQGYQNVTPLLRISYKLPPLDIIQIIVKYAPEVLKMKDDTGVLPIHLACESRVSLEVIQALITASPDTIKIEDSRGRLPIHWACFNHAAPNVLNLLIESYTEGMYHKDKLGRTPLDCLKDKKHAEKKDDNGMLAVHHTCKMGYSISLVCFLIQAYPESITFPDNEGRTPFQYIQVVSSEKDESGMLLLHRQAADSKWLSVGMLQILCDAYPESIQLKDKFGLLPIHYAYLNEWTSIDTLMFLLTRYPESVLSCT